MKITIEATIEADIKKVWTHYTEPHHIVHWNFASPDWCCPSAENDLRVGGTYKARMEAKDKSVGFDFEANYLEVLEGKRLVYKMLDGRDATITFDDLSNETKVIIIFDAETENPVEMQKNGWQAILTNFKEYVECN